MKRSDVVNEINNLKGESGHKWVVSTYNTINPLPRGYKLQDNDLWCAATVSAILHKFGYDDIAECGTPSMIKKAKNKGIWVENDAYVPTPGDIIMYDWEDDGKGDCVGEPNHVGIVTKVEGNKITVREGNKGGTIGNRTINVNGKTIRGYIVPKYDEEGSTSNNTDESATSSTSVEKPEQKPTAGSQGPNYKVGRTYTIKVNSALNVRKGPSTKYGLVGYNNLTANAKEHALGSALLPGTRVTCNEVKKLDSGEVWIRIPSGWICACTSRNQYVV